MNRIAGIFLVALLALAGTALAAPTGPNSITVIGTGRFGTSEGQTNNAQAGNTTEMNLYANGITQTWQGYFGNVTGSIILGDANNNTFYDWNSASPHGEIYATRTSGVPAWSSIKCANSSDIVTEDTALGVDESTDADSVNATFVNTTSFSQFYVGSVPINTSQNCYAAKMYNSTGQPSPDSFAEVLLHDGSNLVYTGLLEQDSTGFDGRTHDFQMLVGENGHLGDTATTTYYFYLELG